MVQVNFNLADQRAVDLGLLDLAAERDTGIIGRTPLAFGYLSGGLTGDETFVGSDHRANWPREQLRRRAEAASLFGATDQRRTRAQYALGYCLSHSEISTVIPGMLTPEHVCEIVAASELAPLPPADLGAIRTYHEHVF